MPKFGCSNRMVTHLAMEKGILSTRNLKIGKALEDETAEVVRMF